MKDSIERIERDARLEDVRDYWKCRGYRCYFECPNVKDGQDPAQRYGTGSDCEAARRLDLLNRLRAVLLNEKARTRDGWTKDVVLDAATWRDEWPAAVSCIKGGERLEYVPARAAKGGLVQELRELAQELRETKEPLVCIDKCAFMERLTGIGVETCPESLSCVEHMAMCLETIVDRIEAEYELKEER